MSFIDVEFAGRQFRLDAANGRDLVARQIGQGSYEPPLPMLLMATLVRTEGAFIDVGANTGVYSVMAGIIAAPRPIFAFEPLPPVAEIMRGNLKENGLAAAVRLSTDALSDKPGRARLHIPDPGHGLIETSASLEREFKNRDGSGSAIEVNVTTLDEAGIPGPVAVIKVDIEGHEDAFLRGARATMARERPMMFIEVLEMARRQAIGAVLRETSYMDFRLRPDLAIHDGGEVLFDHLAWNHALVPIERLQRFKDACDSCGLPMLRRFTFA